MNMAVQQLSAEADKVIVHKFGGSSLATAERFHAVADILLQQPQQSAWVVVSAPGDTTDHLLDLIAAAADAVSFDTQWQQLSAQLRLLVNRTLSALTAPQALNTLNNWLAQLPALVQAGQHNEVLATGEKLSALLLSAVLTERKKLAQAIDARDFLRLELQPLGDAQVLWQQSAALLAPLK